jgi:DNA-directed RNA polymerase subunit RPC12/RpoP
MGTKKEEVDLCVLCKEPTTYKISDHVDKRSGYIEGMGQLCPECEQRILWKKRQEEYEWIRQ